MTENHLRDPLGASGIHVIHHAEKPDGTFERHKGGFDECPALECQWPRLGEMVTIVSGDRQVTGILKAKSTRSATVETADGSRYWAALAAVTRPAWGTYCQHGTKIVEAVPAEHTCQLPPPPCDMPGVPGHRCSDHRPCKACYPEGRKISPWPCDREGCTEADFDREEREAEEQYWEEMCREAYNR